MRKYFIVLSMAMGLLIACSPKIGALTQADADKIASAYPGTTLAELKEGKTLYETHCNACHALKNPTSMSAAGWAKIVPPMVEGTNKKAGKQVINAKQETIIIKYLAAVCEKKVEKK
ncbi:MAG: hypothetical protein ACKVTZ_17550 [Bacteroidia bacterium]